jgi:hypothetical protein
MQLGRLLGVFEAEANKVLGDATDDGAVQDDECHFRSHVGNRVYYRRASEHQYRKALATVQHLEVQDKDGEDSASLALSEQMQPTRRHMHYRVDYRKEFMQTPTLCASEAYQWHARKNASAHREQSTQYT